MIRFTMLASLIFSFLFTQGCGFQLRGLTGIDGTASSLVALKGVYIKGSGGVVEQLNRQIQLLQLQPSTRPKTKPNSQISVAGEKIEQKILTLNINNQVREYRIYLELGYHIEFQGEMLLENGFLRIFRDYSYDTGAILGKEAEQRMLIDDMYRDAANQILQRAIILIAKHKNSQPSSSIPSVGSP